MIASVQASAPSVRSVPEDSRMSERDDALAQAERHVRECRDSIAREIRSADEMERAGHLQEAAIARNLITALYRSLDLVSNDLRRQRRARGLEP